MNKFLGYFETASLQNVKKTAKMVSADCYYYYTLKSKHLDDFHRLDDKENFLGWAIFIRKQKPNFDYILIACSRSYSKKRESSKKWRSCS